MKRLAFIGYVRDDGSLLSWAEAPERANCCGQQRQAFVSRNGHTLCLTCDVVALAAAPGSFFLRPGEAASFPPVDGLAADGSRTRGASASPSSGPDAAQGTDSTWRGSAW